MGSSKELKVEKDAPFHIKLGALGSVRGPAGAADVDYQLFGIVTHKYAGVGHFETVARGPVSCEASAHWVWRRYKNDGSTEDVEGPLYESAWWKDADVVPAFYLYECVVEKGPSTDVAVVSAEIRSVSLYDIFYWNDIALAVAHSVPKPCSHFICSCSDGARCNPDCRLYSWTADVL